MKKTKSYLFILLVICVVAFSALYYIFRIQPTTGIKDKTEIIKYKQTYVPKENEPGNCWTTSIAAPTNENAWRCMSEQFIYDPCFKTELGKIVCGVDPDVSESGFELKLTEALPERTDFKFKEEDILSSWIVELKNGLKCGMITGTATLVGKEYAYYQCQENIVLVGFFDKSSPLWKAKVAYLKEASGQAIKQETINVLKSWE